MDIKVGECVRTIDGKIVQILNSAYEDYGERGNIVYLVDKKIWDGTDGFNEYSEWIFPDQIKKHAFNPKDLIEEGDYANERLVLQVDYKNKNVCLLIPFTDTQANTNICWYGYEDIETLVTKEQFERKKHVFGGK